MEVRKIGQMTIVDVFPNLLPCELPFLALRAAGESQTQLKNPLVTDWVVSTTEPTNCR